MDENNVLPGPETLSQYRRIAEIGRGGMARVYLAVVPGLAGFNKLLVIKQIEKHYAEDPEFLAMFLDEARLAARLSHANIVQTYQIGTDNGQYFIAMEYLEGQSFYHALTQLKPKSVPLGLHIRVLVDTLAGLEYAHNIADYDGTPLEVVHRDVSPQNVFITYDGRVKVVDFGIAKALGSSNETQKGVIKGKLAYMSPEQSRCERVDHRSDIFSVGVMLWEAVTQRGLWRGMNDIEILRRLQTGDIPSPDSIQPAALAEVCRKALAPRREDRYSSAAEFQAALERWLEETQDKSQLRELGKLVAQAFEAERGKVQSLVESHFRSVSSGVSSYRQQTPSEPQNAEVATTPRLSLHSTRSFATTLRTTPTELANQQFSSSDTLLSTAEQRSNAGRRPAAEPHVPVEQPSDLITIRTSELPPHPPRRKAVTVALLLVGSIIVGFAGATVLFARDSTPGNTAPAGGLAAPTAGPLANTGPAISGEKSLKQADGADPESMFERTANVELRPALKLDSKPAGATVTERGQSLGTTPLILPLSADQRSPRQFVVTLNGYLPYTVDQGPTEKDVVVTATLTPQPTSAQRLLSATSTPLRPSATVVVEPPLAPSSSAAPGSIRLRTSR